jgi:hypothetical protein
MNSPELKFIVGVGQSVEKYLQAEDYNTKTINSKQEK